MQEERLKLQKSYNLMARHLSLHWQLALLIILIIATYWDGIWAGAPRSDQTSYLHQLGRYKGLWDILSSAPSFNRTESAGDYLLYRPILYLQLGLSYFFFGYDFVRWQLLSLALHVWLVARLFLLFPQQLRRNSALPFLLCLVFATSAIASEQVLWKPYDRVSFVPAPDLRLSYVSPILFVAKRHAQSDLITSFRFHGTVHL